MKLNIGQSVRSLRLQRSLTQQALADALGVSCQSVSRWELGDCYPDIELLPAIANFFGVTTDALFEMDVVRSEQRRREIFTTALDYERQENWTAAIAVLQDAAATYPADDGLLAELALALSKTGRKQDQLDAATLCQKVLVRSTDEKLRSTVRANLCFLYKATGMDAQALALGRTLPHIWECREFLLPDLVSQETRQAAIERALNLAAQVLQDVVSQTPISFSLGYRPQEGIDTGTLRSALTGTFGNS